MRKNARGGPERGPSTDSACYAQIYLDNAPYYRGSDKEEVPDLNRFQVSQIESIEYYSSPAQTPMKYAKLNSNCGVLVIHTRRSR